MEVELANETVAKALMQRTVLTKRLYELWGEGTSVSDVKAQVKQLPRDVVEPYTRENSSFRIVVETFNKKLSTSDKISRIETIVFTSLNSITLMALHNLPKNQAEYTLEDGFLMDREPGYNSTTCRNDIL
ncbi:tRNA (Guanine(10)-N2)-methyltransferase [Elysia marginata]|uniref:tRNA (Guanine(10)-N2)-methyltransferase n=1 Tax=Elysia marginata TaxID=1093978 RepID=A0AAV4EIL8_9GAST|nr:tRNA (Guanine(10)-N2)-methyltransferase [Elysia marginata]